MRLTVLGKIVLLILAIGVAVGGWRFWQNASGGRTAEGGADAGSSGETTPVAAGRPQPRSGSDDQGLLGRPLRVGVVTWPGYAGGITANNGFKPNRDCIYWRNHRLLVEFMLMEDVDARAKAFARGGRDGVDIVWSTVDFWANELPGFIKGRVPARAIMQVDWSRGGDAIVADRSIRRIEDLRGKRVSLALFTPSHWLLEYSLKNSSLDETAQAQIVKTLVGKNASPDARADFVARKVDAAVVWEPDVTEALKKRPNSHVLVSTKDAANLIADLMVAREDFIRQHPAVICAFIKGWFDGTVEANRNSDLVVRLLMENEPLYKDLGEQATRDGLATVKWADLTDNTRMFGLDGKEPLFDRIFQEASRSWVKRGYISQPVLPAQAKNVTCLKEIYAEVPKAVRPAPGAEEFDLPKPSPAVAKKPAIMTRPVNIFFATGSASLDPNSRQVLDQVALTAQTYSNAYLQVEGNTDSSGNAQRNVLLSGQRAQAVVNYLVRRYGFDRDRFLAKGNGPRKPVASNASAEGRARNRRTDIRVIPR